jgi:hypothetical protein
LILAGIENESKETSFDSPLFDASNYTLVRDFSANCMALLTMFPQSRDVTAPQPCEATI